MVQVSWRWFHFRPAAFAWLTGLGRRRVYTSVAARPPAEIPPAPTSDDVRLVQAMPLRARPALRVDAGAHLRYPIGEAPRPSLAFGADAYLAAFGQSSPYGGDGAAS